jgi:Tol biopolymer transport system component
MYNIKRGLYCFICTFFVLFYLSGCKTNDSRTFQGQYLGQKPPGLIPEIFAPDVISGKFNLHGFPAFSPNGKEIYWPVLPPKILFMKYENNSWTNPAEASFSENNSQAPCFSPDGNKIYYQVSRSGGFGSLDIWYVEKIGIQWSNPKNIGQPINSSKLESQPSFTKDGTIYFTGELEGVMANRGIYRAKYANGKYLTPELLGDNINTKYLEIYPFIALDESYLLFCSTRPSMEEINRRIFISFRMKSGKWSEPINLNKKINFNYQSAFPYVSPDGKYLFFTAKGGIYWMSAKIIEQLRPNEN